LASFGEQTYQPLWEIIFFHLSLVWASVALEGATKWKKII